MTTNVSTDILLEQRGNAGLITLNRPKALNALSLQMVRDMRRSTSARDWLLKLVEHTSGLALCGYRGFQ